MGISKAANLPDHKVVETPFYNGVTYPNRRRNLSISLLLSLLFPSAIVYFKKSFDNKIRSRAQLEELTAAPIIGFVGHNKYQTNLAVYEKPNSLIAEAFRNIRTNLEYTSSKDDKRVFMVTSTVSFEGKTFIGINLGIRYGLVGQESGVDWNGLT